MHALVIHGRIRDYSFWNDRDLLLWGFLLFREFLRIVVAEVVTEFDHFLIGLIFRTREDIRCGRGGWRLLDLDQRDVFPQQFVRGGEHQLRIFFPQSFLIRRFGRIVEGKED